MSHRSLGLFDQDTRYRKLESLGDPLVVLGKIVPWSMCSGLARVTVCLGLINLVHNLRRLVTKRKMVLRMA